VAFVATLVVRRIVLSRRAHRRQAVEQRLRDQAFALLGDGAPPPAGLSHAEERVFAGLVARLAHQLRGEARAHAAAYADEHGFVDAALADLRSRRHWRRATAAYRLGEMSVFRAVPELRAALDDPTPEVRGAAAGALGKLGSAEAVADIVTALAHRKVPPLVGAGALLGIGSAGLPQLLSLTGSDDPELRARAVELVGLLGTRTEAPAVVEKLRDASGMVRARAAIALGRLGAEEGADALCRTLDDRLPYVRASAAQALGAVGDPKTVPRLLQLAAEDAYEPAHAAAVAAARLDPEQAARAAEELGGPHLREAVAEAAL